MNNGVVLIHYVGEDECVKAKVTTEKSTPKDYGVQISRKIRPRLKGLVEVKNV